MFLPLFFFHFDSFLKILEHVNKKLLNCRLKCEERKENSPSNNKNTSLLPKTSKVNVSTFSLNHMFNCLFTQNCMCFLKKNSFVKLFLFQLTKKTTLANNSTRIYFFLSLSFIFPYQFSVEKQNLKTVSF